MFLQITHTIDNGGICFALEAEPTSSLDKDGYNEHLQNVEKPSLKSETNGDVSDIFVNFIFQSGREYQLCMG